MLFVKNNSKFTQELVNKGADVNIRNCFNELPLQKAIENKSLSSVQLLIEARAKTEELVGKGKSLLNIAVEMKNLDILQVLLESGANPNFCDEKLRNCLHVAFNSNDSSANASFDVESLLLQFKADINAVDCRGRSPLHYSFVKIGKHEDFSQIDPIESVSSACALEIIDLNIQDLWRKTPLHYAAQRGALTSTMFMLNKGADLELEDEEGNTALGISIKEGHANYSVMLVQQKANVLKKVKVHTKKQKEHLSAKVQKISSKMLKFVINPPDPEAPSRLPEGEYSMFRAAVIQGFQGLAYLLIFNGYPYMLAMQDAMTHNKFQLVKTLLAKVSDNRQLQQVNEKGQNLFHTLAIYGAKADQIITRSLCKQLKDRGVKFKEVDKENRNPLHYACQSGYLELARILLENGVSYKVEDVFGIRPVAYAMQGKKILDCVKTLEVFIGFGADLNVKIKDGLVELPPLLHAINQKAPIHIIKFLMDNGSSISDKDSLGRTALMYSIMNNDLDLATALLNEKRIKLKDTDQSGRNCLHYIVQPLQYGSYENQELLKLLLSTKEITDNPDSKGKTAYSLALNQRSGRLSEVFQSFGFKSKAGASPLPENEKLSDYESDGKIFNPAADAAEYIKRQKDLQRTEEISRSPDPIGEFPDYYKVVENYDLLMTKVDLSHGPFSAYVFYRMQLLEDTNRSVFVLFTRWGRIGETGAHQRTPFADFDEGCKEFCKIFKNKSGNEWGEMFEKKKGKYVPMKLNLSQTRFHDFIKEFDEKNCPPCKLPKETESLLKICTSQTMYRSLFSKYSVDINILNFSSISKDTLERAESILLEISSKSKEMMKETETDLKIQIIQDIQDLSSRYYELIPVIHERNSAIPPIISDRDILQNIEKINILKNMELASKLILAALNVQLKINPYDYIFSCLHTNLTPLARESPEFEMIHTYIRKSQENHQLLTVHKLCREGEPRRIRQFSHEKRRKLLWHGTSAANIIGILTQGLKIAPPEVPNTGYMFGKGIYFADCFSKSFGYCFDFYDRNKSVFLLLCEVVIGKVLPKKNAEFIEKLDKEYLATLGVGKMAPDPKGSVFTPYGVEVPLGELIESGDMTLVLNYNEYIVYDVAQVRMRYLVEIKADE
jgi:ankyrin repeat protein/predicted DNA-binding WGR domain protein